jgi:putative transposase
MRRSKQMALELGRYTVTRHRGGRPVGPNPRVRHLSRKPFPDSHPCHVTLRVRAGMPSLRQEHVVREIEPSFRRGRERKDFRLVHYSLQADHAHLIVEASDRSALGRGMKALAARFALAVNRALGRRTGKVLADRYHLQILACPRPLSLGAEPAVAEPRTWFLRRGWRLHGLIDPNEIPGALET